MLRVVGDFETKSYADLTKVGAWVYSEHPTTEVIWFCYKINDGVTKCWRPGMENPVDLFEALAAGAEFEAHNVGFERSIWHNIMVARHGWPAIADHLWRDTMAVASYYALPPGLDKLALALGFGGKNPEGGRLITKYSKLHLKTAKPVIPPEDLEKFRLYCVDDVELEFKVGNFLGDLPDHELPMFLLDQEMNMRGLLLDVPGIQKAIEVVEKRAVELEAEYEGIVGWRVTQRDKSMAWFKAHGLDLPDMQAETLEELLEDGELPQGPIRRAIEIRLRASKASTKKLDAMARNAGADGRARYQTRYHGAGTGRNTGAGFQPLNLSRGDESIDPERLVADIMHGDPAWLDMIYGDATEAVSNASRHWIMAAPGHRIISGDYASVEAVILAAGAGEEWKLDAFRSGVEIYSLMADKIYGLPPGTVTKKTHPLERQDGKIGELAFGYQGSLGAWLGFDRSGRHSDERILEINRAWRLEHPMTVKFWHEAERNAIAAVQNPGTVQRYRQMAFEMVDDWLTMILPDGKRLWYYKPELRVGMPKWHTPLTNEECREGTCDHKPKVYLTYMAWKFGAWKRISTYGGKLVENWTQATSRQKLKAALLRLKAAGYPLILSVYDEAVAEVPNGFGSVEEFRRIMLEPAGDWDREWPIDVGVWEGDRYKK